MVLLTSLIQAPQAEIERIGEALSAFRRSNIVLKGRMALGGQHRHLYGSDCPSGEYRGTLTIQEYTMTTARDFMPRATCVGEHETLTAAAQHIGELGVGALPISDDNLASKS